VSLEDEIRTLQQMPMFRGLDPGRLKLMAFSGQRISYRKGETLFEQGASSDAVFVILEGDVDVERVGPAGAVPVAQLGATELIGEMGVLCDKPRAARIVARSDTKVLRIDKATFLELVQQTPELSMRIIRELSRRLEQVNERLAAAHA
jgi:CRP/FNR family transcriptional regulator, cyclic AMP receptor protein